MSRLHDAEEIALVVGRVREVNMFTKELSVESNDFEQARPDLERVLCPIEMKIVEGLYALCPEGYDRKWSTPDWTHRVKEELTKVGESEGLLVYPQLKKGEDGKKRFEGE